MRHSHINLVSQSSVPVAKIKIRSIDVDVDELSKSHHAALAQGYSHFRNVMKIWTPTNSTWTPATLLVSGVNVFWLVMCGNSSAIGELDREEYQWFKNHVEIFYIPCSKESLFDTIWCHSTFYGALPQEIRRMFNAAAYKISAARCWRVKHICLDPPRVPVAPKLMALLQNYTPFDCAQLIILFTLDSYFPNHIRCCAASLDNTRCTRKRNLTFHSIFCHSHALDPDTIAVSGG